MNHPLQDALIADFTVIYTLLQIQTNNEYEVLSDLYKEKTHISFQCSERLGHSQSYHYSGTIVIYSRDQIMKEWIGIQLQIKTRN